MKPRLADIQRAVCRHFGITRDELLSDSKVRPLSEPRQICFFLAHEIAAMGPTQIGRLMGRDHSTVTFGINAIRAKWFERGMIYHRVNRIRRAVQDEIAEQGEIAA